MNSWKPEFQPKMDYKVQRRPWPKKRVFLLYPTAMHEALPQYVYFPTEVPEGKLYCCAVPYSVLLARITTEDFSCLLQNLKNQIMTTNLWVEQVSYGI
jgi:hypothetical protein